MTPAMLGIIGWIFFGFIIGLVARALMPGRDPLGFFATTILGILGALTGGMLGQALGLYPPGSRAGFLGAVVGSLVLLFAYRSYARRRARESVAQAVQMGRPRTQRLERQKEERKRSA